MSLIEEALRRRAQERTGDPLAPRSAAAPGPQPPPAERPLPTDPAARLRRAPSTPPASERAPRTALLAVLTGAVVLLVLAVAAILLWRPAPPAGPVPSASPGTAAIHRDADAPPPARTSAPAVWHLPTPGATALAAQADAPWPTAAASNPPPALVAEPPPPESWATIPEAPLATTTNAVFALAPAAGAPAGASNQPPAQVVEAFAVDGWPLFRINGVATVGQVTLVILDSGEMLGEGDVSARGVAVDQVSKTGARFRWNEQTKLLRKGDPSGRPSR